MCAPLLSLPELFPRNRLMSGQRSDAFLRSKLVEQCLGFLQKGRIEALSEPAVGRDEEIAGRIELAMIAPEPGKTGRRAQLPELREFAGLRRLARGQSLAPSAGMCDRTGRQDTAVSRAVATLSTSDKVWLAIPRCIEIV